MVLLEISLSLRLWTAFQQPLRATQLYLTQEKLRTRSNLNFLGGPVVKSCLPVQET